MKKKLNIAVFLSMIAFSVVIVLNLFNISIRDSAKYQAMANNNQFKSTVITAGRGSIYDTNGKILAQSATVYSIVLNPHRLSEADNEKIDPETGKTEAVRMADSCARILAEELDVTEEEVREQLKDTEKKWALVAKKIEKPVADKILQRASDEGLGDLIGTEVDTKRYYPQGTLAASVIGFTNYEGDGVYGVESYYNDYLKGVDGKILSAVDGFGNEMPYKNDKMYESQDGNSLYLTLDMTLQYYVEKYLEQAVVENNVQERACAIIMDVNSGAIKAMATVDGFDLNDRNSIYSKKDINYLAGLEGTESYDQEYAAVREKQWKNKAVTELYYPGSVFKVVTGSSALEEGAITLDSTFTCNQVINVAGTDIHCWARYSHGTQDFTTAMTKSCNPAFIQIGQALGKEKFSKYFEAYGFTEPTGIDLPSEASSIYVKEENMGPVELASSSFGQTIKVTPIQMITAYAAVVNGGYLLTPYVVSKIVDPNGNVIKTTDSST